MTMMKELELGSRMMSHGLANSCSASGFSPPTRSVPRTPFLPTMCLTYFVLRLTSLIRWFLTSQTIRQCSLFSLMKWQSPYGKENSASANEPSLYPFLPVPIYSINLCVTASTKTIRLFDESAIIKISLTFSYGRGTET